MPFDKLGRINPRPFILTHGFAFIIFCLVGIAKSIKIYRFFFRFATFQYTIVYIRFMNFHSIWQGRKKKKKKKRCGCGFKQNSGDKFKIATLEGG